MMGDTWFGRHAYYMAERHQAAGTPSYLYFYERTPPSAKQTIGAGHAQELFPLFQSWIPFWPRNQRDDELEEEMQRYWTRFALNGNPNEANLPYWPIFDPTSAKEMAFANEGSYARNVLRKARYDAMREQQSDENLPRDHHLRQSRHRSRHRVFDDHIRSQSTRDATACSIGH